LAQLAILLLYGPPCQRISLKRRWLADRSFRSVDADSDWCKLHHNDSFALLFSVDHRDDPTSRGAQCGVRHVRSVPSRVWFWHYAAFGDWIMRGGYPCIGGREFVNRQIGGDGVAIDTKQAAIAVTTLRCRCVTTHVSG